MYTNEKPASVVTAPSTPKLFSKWNLFLIGGISNCPNWQNDIIEQLRVVPDLTIFNPRRDNFDIYDPSMSDEQIEWEFRHLGMSNIFSVWFSRGSINPITLYELGMWVNARPDIPAFIGVDPEYERGYDVFTQTKLARPSIQIVDSIPRLAGQLLYFFESADS